MARRHPHGIVRANLYRRLDPHKRGFVASRGWSEGRALQPKPNAPRHELFVEHFPQGGGERWVQIAAYDGEPGPTVPAQEVYTYREGLTPEDRSEMLETRRPDGRYDLQVWVAEGSRQEHAPERGSLNPEVWQELLVSREFHDYPLDRVWNEAEHKLATNPVYQVVAQAALENQAPHVLELGSGPWPVIPLALLEKRPDTQYSTVDCSYQSLWLLDRALQDRHPEWSSHVHRLHADYTEPLPLPSDSVDVAVSLSAFGPKSLDAPYCWQTLQELDRTLKPGGLLVFDQAAFEERPAWLLWSFTRRFQLEPELAPGALRTMCVRAKK